MDNVIVGRAFAGFRNDGRYFNGIVESVRSTSKGTLVILHTVESVSDGQFRTVFKSFYLESMDHYTCIVTDSWPEGSTLADYTTSVGG